MEEQGAAPVRLAELVAALSLGIDLGFGQPMEHVLRQCRIALRLAELSGLDEDARSAIFYSALMVNVGCHTDAHEQAHWFGDDIALKATKYKTESFSVADTVLMLRMLGSGGTPLHRIRIGLAFAVSGHQELEDMISRHAALARALGEELGLDSGALTALAASYERWDGKGFPGALSGEQIPHTARIIHLAEFLEVAHRDHGLEAAVNVGRQRAGTQFDPALVRLLEADAEKIFHQLDELDSWDQVVDGEPGLTSTLSPAECDEALVAIARFVDLKSPYTLGHSAAVADLASTAAADLGLPPTDEQLVGRAGLVSGWGRLGVSNAIWDKPGPLTPSDWERIRLFPHYTERMLSRSPTLAPAGRIAGQVGERLDGSGYPRGLDRAGISLPSMIVATAEAFRSRCEARPHRSGCSADRAAQALRDDVRAGRLDNEVVDAVLRAAGQQAGRRRRTGAAGLTVREVEVLQLVARGLTTKEIGKRLHISPKTAANHVEHIYTKVGATNRASACLYAMRQGLVTDPD